jgi:TonB family protein
MKYLALTLGALSAFPTFADDVNPASLHLETVVNAEALNRVSPSYPRTAAATGKEGWVRLSYIIGEDGKVANAIVEDSSGIKGFENSALTAISQWEFSPATENGEPIEQCRNNVQFDFILDGDQKGASKRFLKKYKQIANHIDENKLQEAEPLLKELQDSPKWNMYEVTCFWYLQAMYYAKSNLPKKQIEALVRIVGNGEKYLPNDYYLRVLREVFVLDINLQRLSYALEIFERIEKVDTDGKLVSELQPYKDKIEKYLQSDSPILVAAEVEERGLWNHRLNRNQFSFAEVEGLVGQFDVRCDNKRSTFKVATGYTWNVPESWGQCTLFVYGEQGAHFTLLE